MKIHYLQHVPYEGPAYLETYARNIGAEFSGTRLCDGEPLPGRMDFDLLVIMGGPMGVYDEKRYTWLVQEKLFIEKSMRAGKKIIGICLGAQLIADILGAIVHTSRCREIGWFPVKRSDGGSASRVGRILPEIFFAFHWHGDVFDIPRGAVHIAESIACKNQGFVYDERVLGLQFHLESTAESVRGLYDNCGGELDTADFIQKPDEILRTNHIHGCNKLFEIMLDTLMSA
jgi:GMP synthase (glutamine-hydrolysing)